MKYFGHARRTIGTRVQDFRGDVVVIQARADSCEARGVEWAVVLGSVAFAALILLKKKRSVVARDRLRQLGGWIVGESGVRNGDRYGAVFGRPEETEGGWDIRICWRGVTNQDFVWAFAEANSGTGVVRFGGEIGCVQDFFAVQEQFGFAGEFDGEGVLRAEIDGNEAGDFCGEGGGWEE